MSKLNQTTAYVWSLHIKLPCTTNHELKTAPPCRVPRKAISRF